MELVFKVFVLVFKYILEGEAFKSNVIRAII